MGKSKKKYVRPNYTAKTERKKAKKPMPKWLKIGIPSVVGALLLAVILFAIFYDNGSLPMRNGKVVNEIENALIANLSTRGNDRYYNVGEVLPPEGYTLDDERHYKSDSNETDFYYVPDDEASQITMLYYGAQQEAAATLVQSAHESFAAMFGEDNVSDVVTTVMANRPVYYYTATLLSEDTADVEQPADEEQATDPTDQSAIPEGEPPAEGEPLAEDEPLTDDEQTPDTPAMKEELIVNCYVTTIRKASILIQMTLKVTDEMPAPDGEELRALVEAAVANLWLEPLPMATLSPET